MKWLLTLRDILCLLGFCYLATLSRSPAWDTFCISGLLFCACLLVKDNPFTGD